VFDLDNTLYPADCNLFRQIDARMATFIRKRLGVPMGEARRLQKDYYARYGTTMYGLMREHGVAADDFLTFVHDIDLSPVARNEVLAARLKSLPGRRYVFTNGSVAHAERVMKRLGVGEAIDDIFDIKAADFIPKPHRRTYERFLSAHAIAAKGAAMFEDIAGNLEAAFELGMTTVLVSSRADWISDEPSHKRPARPGDRHDHVHHVTDDLAAFLGAIETRGGALADGLNTLLSDPCDVEFEPFLPLIPAKAGT
jgi:putative hydrolase of the HAD superfamily